MNKNILFFLGGFVLLTIVFSQFYFLNGVNPEQDFDVKIDMAEQLEPKEGFQCGGTDPVNHMQTWTADCHATQTSLHWNQIGHEYMWTRDSHGSNITWQWVAAGHLYNISRIIHSKEDSRTWELDFHSWSTSNLWIVDGHNYTTSQVWIAQGHNYNFSIGD